MSLPSPRAARRRGFSGAAAVAACILTLARLPLGAAEPASGAALAQQLRSFRETTTVLHVAAHPDDENTQLLTALARGRGYRTAYLSITRGDGGQNEIGPEFDEKLGLARTQELLAARALDGAHQFFTRAIDFGYSKSPDEALTLWQHDAVLGDVVRVIRHFRPDVIVTRFSPEPGNTHGQHTASAILALEAFRLAGDPTAYPDQVAAGLAPWQPTRIVWNNTPFGAAATATAGLRLEVGGDDPVTGEAFGAIARRSRAMHLTQGFGTFANARSPGGSRLESFQLLAGAPTTTDLFAGVDSTWRRYPGGAAVQALADSTLAAFNPTQPAASLPALLLLRAALAPLPADPLVTAKRRQLDHLIRDCLGLTLATTVPQAEVVPGEALALHHTANLTANFPVRWVAVRYPATGATVPVGLTLAPGTTVTRDLRATLPATTPLSQPYWLRAPGTPGLAQVADHTLIGQPENPPAFPVEFIFTLGDQTLALTDEPVQLLPGAPLAQARRRLAVIPPVTLAFAHRLGLFAPGATKPVTVTVTASRAGLRGTLALAAPAGWAITPATQPFILDHAGDHLAATFQITAPAAPASADLAARATLRGATYDSARFTFAYDHLPVQLLQPPARARLVALDATVTRRRVGYLPGAGDSVAASLVELGCTVTPLTGADLTPEKLRDLDTVVLGVRAFNERDDLAARLPALFAFAEAGGTVIAQYNRPNRLKTETLGPYPLSLAGPAPALRVTDELAPITFLAPTHPVLMTPNRITAADFNDWVQERGAYFPSTWDEAHYTPILALSDPGEPPLRGSLLVARHGRGWFVYTGLAFFRQLPAGNPGAHRLFANLLSLSPDAAGNP